VMETAPTIESVLPHLEEALADPSIPARAHIAGRQLLDRLTSPIRVVVTGHPGSGKSQLINLLAGEPVIGEATNLPSLELRHGPERKLTIELADGRTETRPFETLASLDREKVGFVSVEAPLDVLRSMTLTEVVTGGTAEQERDGVLWAAERADIVLWCSLEFTPAEQWLWSAMPERLKDHGFLVLTKADTLIRSGTLGQRIAELEDIVAEEFHSLVPVATLQGLKALRADGGPDLDALSASGAAALSAALVRHVEQGLRADLDAALMFLSRFGSEPAPIATVPAAASPQMQPDSAEKSREVPKAPPPIAVEPPETTGPEAHRAAPDVETPDDPVTAAAHRPEKTDALKSAMDILGACGADLSDVGDEPGFGGAVLARCCAAAQAVSEVLEAGPHASACDDALDVSDKLVLMQLEASEEAAADAVTLLLQLRRDIALEAAG